MVKLSVLPVFLVAAVLISASPGPAMALNFQRAGAHEFRAATWFARTSTRRRWATPAV